MFRIRRIFDDVRPDDRDGIRQVQQILREQFSGVAEEEVLALPGLMRDPFQHRLRYIVLAAENYKGTVRGFAVVAYAPDLKFCYLDFISTAQKMTGGGIGGALYDRVREEAKSLGAIGLFMECLPDDPNLCRNREVLKQNRARLKFYERFGARPIANTAYETPVTPGGDCPPYLVYDPIDRQGPLRRKKAQEIVRAILERKYGDFCPEDYIRMVVASFRDDPVRLREPRYVKPVAPGPQVSAAISPGDRIVLVVNDRHTIHHVKERGYVEAPVRISTILSELDRTDMFVKMGPHSFPEKYILEVHDRKFVTYLKRMCAKLQPGKSVYPYVFPIRNATRPPKELPVRAGYYCMDTFTPLNRNAYQAARRAVDCALTAAQAVERGRRLAYALVRPPGHHAERHVFGGFCYFNSAAVAANYLSERGRVAVVDIDYHHGNGTEDIFYERDDVLTISIHGQPSIAYPYFSGFRDSVGSGPGEGYNLNIPLPEHVDGEAYRRALQLVVKRVLRFRPAYLVLALGLDPAKGDPTGSWSLTPKDFEANGRIIGALGYPTLVVQEGGYRIRNLGVNARHFFQGLWNGAGTV